MREFTVIWKIEVTAESPLAAVIEARDVQLDRTSEATFFQVETSTGEIIDVDILHHHNDEDEI